MIASSNSGSEGVTGERSSANAGLLNRRWAQLQHGEWPGTVSGPSSSAPACCQIDKDIRPLAWTSRASCSESARLRPEWSISIRARSSGAGLAPNSARRLATPLVNAVGGVGATDATRVCDCDELTDSPLARRWRTPADSSCAKSPGSSGSTEGSHRLGSRSRTNEKVDRFLILKRPTLDASMTPSRVATTRVLGASRQRSGALLATRRGSNVASFAQRFQRFHEHWTTWFALVAFHALKAVAQNITDRGDGIGDAFELELFRHIGVPPHFGRRLPL